MGYFNGNSQESTRNCATGNEEKWENCIWLWWKLLFKGTMKNILRVRMVTKLASNGSSFGTALKQRLVNWDHSCSDVCWPTMTFVPSVQPCEMEKLERVSLSWQHPSVNMKTGKWQTEKIQRFTQRCKWFYSLLTNFYQLCYENAGIWCLAMEDAEQEFSRSESNPTWFFCLEIMSSNIIFESHWLFLRAAPLPLTQWAWLPSYNLTSAQCVQPHSWNSDMWQLQLFLLHVQKKCRHKASPEWTETK